MTLQIFYDSLFSIMIILSNILHIICVDQVLPALIGLVLYKKYNNLALAIFITLPLYVGGIAISFFSVWVYAGIPEFSFLDVILIFLTIFLFKRRRFITIFVLWKAVEIAVYFFGSTFFSDRIQ